MSRQYYNPESVGGSMVAEFVDAVIKAKDAGERLAALLQATSDNGTQAYVIETSGANGTIFGVIGGQGQNFYNELLHETTGIITTLNAVPENNLADLDMG